jgi:hypothetical protein
MYIRMRQIINKYIKIYAPSSAHTATPGMANISTPQQLAHLRFILLLIGAAQIPIPARFGTTRSTRTSTVQKRVQVFTIAPDNKSVSERAIRARSPNPDNYHEARTEQTHV